MFQINKQEICYISNIVVYQYGEIQVYDASLILDTSAGEQEQHAQDGQQLGDQRLSGFFLEDRTDAAFRGDIVENKEGKYKNQH